MRAFRYGGEPGQVRETDRMEDPFLGDERGVPITLQRLIARLLLIHLLQSDYTRASSQATAQVARLQRSFRDDGEPIGRSSPLAWTSTESLAAADEA